MTNEKNNPVAPREAVADPTRRDFIARSLAAGVVVAASPTLSAAEAVVESNVTIKTPDGICDAAFFHPASGSHPAVLVWPDAFGLRPAMRDIGARTGNACRASRTASNAMALIRARSTASSNTGSRLSCANPHIVDPAFSSGHSSGCSSLTLATSSQA